MTNTHEIGEHEVIDVQAMRKRWEQSRVYSVVPEEVSASLHMLVRAGHHASLEEMKPILEKMVEVFTWAWPSGIEVDSVPCKQFTIMVPREVKPKSLK